MTFETLDDLQIFLQEAQEVIDNLNNNLRLTDAINYMCDYKRITLGLSTFGVSEIDDFQVRAMSFAGIETFLSGCDLIAWGKKATHLFI